MTGLDGPDGPGRLAGGPQDVEGAVRVVGGDDGEHADPEVEDVLHLLLGDAARGSARPRRSWYVPGATGHQRVAAVGEHSGQVAGDAPAGDVREGVHVDSASQVEHRRRVDVARAKQLGAERVAGAPPRWTVEAHVTLG